MSDWRPNVRLGPLSQKLAPGFGWCLRCKTAWPFVQKHSTIFNRRCGCFPLCQDCWGELTIPERVPFYRALYDDWLTYGPVEDSWEQIESAVLAGG